MSRTRSVALGLTATVLAAAVAGCAVPQGAALQGGRTNEAPRGYSVEGYDREAGPMGGMSYGGAGDTREGAVIERARDYEREAGPMGGMDYAAPTTDQE